MHRIAPQADLCSKAPQCDLCLIGFDRTEPSPRAGQNVVDRFGALGEPPEVIWIAMSLNSAEALQCSLQPYEHIRRHANLTMLRGRDTDSKPVRGALSRS